nr:fasciclin domain-containing protein [Bacteroidales bacterium]
MLYTYGSFTCFAPTNRAVEEYLALYNLSSVEELSDKQCDTIANSHLINRAYFTTDMTDGVISTPNQFDRYLSISFVVADSLSGTMAYFINKQSQIVLRDDSVENGVVHTIDKVIRPSNSLLPELMREDTTIRLFYEAMVLTTFDDSLLLYMDYDYVQPKLVLHYTSHVNRETAIAPKYRKYGYTGFVEPDEVYRQKGINNMNDLIAYAKKVYDEVYPQDANLYDDDFTHPKNPLNRFV